MSDTTETETETDTTDEPSKAELHDRVRKLESTVEKLMPSRRDALRMGAAGLAGAAGLGAATQPAEASTGSAGQIGDSNNRPDLFADTVDANQLTGSAAFIKTKTRAFLSSSTSADPIPFDSVSYDPDNNFDTSTHEYTVPGTGTYLTTLQVRLSQLSSGTKGVFSLTQNGNNISQIEITSQGSFGSVTNTDIRQFSSGDKIAVANSSTVQVNLGSNSTFLCIIRVE